MHRTNRVPRAAITGLLLTSLVFGGAAPAGAQPPDVIPPPRPVGAPGAAAIIVPVGGTQRLSMTKKQLIKAIRNDRPAVASVQAQYDAKTGIGDPMVAIVSGLTPGRARITLEGADGTSENFDVIVQTDVEYLQSLIQRAVPTANVTLIPGGGGSLILTGNVTQAQDVDTIVRIAQTSPGVSAGQVINAMSVGGVMQVQLDVVVARVRRSEARRMSFEFFNDGQQHFFSSGLERGLILPSRAITGTFPGGPQIFNSITPQARMFLGIFNSQQEFFGFLAALRDEGVAKILTQPKVTTLSGRPAYFLSGGEIPIPQAGGLGTTTIQFRPFGTSIDVLPIVLGNGRIHLEVQPEVSARNDANGITSAGTFVPGFDTQRVRTAVQMDSGQTLAIGGMIETTSSVTTRKVPLLGDLPFIGLAFRAEDAREEENELVVLVTPYLVDPMSCDQLPAKLPGQETRMPDDFELFLEGILEAPRGPRAVCKGHCYVPAWKNDPTVTKYPCAGKPIRPGPGCVRAPNEVDCQYGGPGCAGCNSCGSCGGNCGGCVTCGSGACGPNGCCTGGNVSAPAAAAASPAALPAGAAQAPVEAVLPPASPAVGIDPVLPPAQRVPGLQ